MAAAGDYDEDGALVLSHPFVDPRTQLFTLVATKFDCDSPAMLWREGADFWPGVVCTATGALLELNGETPQLLRSLRLDELGPSLLTNRLTVLKFSNTPKIKGHLRALAACSGLRTLVLHDTHIKGSLKDLEGMPHLRRLNLSRTKVVGSVASLGKCPELQTVLLSDTKVNGHVEAFERCPDLSYCQLDYTQVFGAVECFHKCTGLFTLNLQYTQVTGNSAILRFAAPRCPARDVLAMHQRLDPGLH
jgi:hypothetical protein